MNFVIYTHVFVPLVYRPSCPQASINHPSTALMAGLNFYPVLQFTKQNTGLLASLKWASDPPPQCTAGKPEVWEWTDLSKLSEVRCQLLSFLCLIPLYLISKGCPSLLQEKNQILSSLKSESQSQWRPTLSHSEFQEHLLVVGSETTLKSQS